MNVPSFLAIFPVTLLLLQWTLLLSLGWAAHWLLRRRHSRSRVILWRSVLVFLLLIPLMRILPIPWIEAPVAVAPLSVAVPAGPLATAPAEFSSSAKLSAATSSKETTGSEAFAIRPPGPKAAFKLVSWQTVLLLVWVAGFAFFAFRLARLHFQLSRLRDAAIPGGIHLQRKLSETRLKMAVKRPVEIRLSREVRSPFVCGIRKPVIMLPESLATGLSGMEADTLLGHEIAHVRHRDVFWCVAWRWMSALFWFHPLVWRIPAAHNLVCELEADRLASDQTETPASYLQILAQLALRVTTVPPVETRLTANGASQIVRRLNHLRKQGTKAWKRKHTFAAFGLVAIILLLAAGWEFGTRGAVKDMTFRELVVSVEDEGGKPIADAAIKTTALRVFSEGANQASLYGWVPERHGPPSTARTDSAGKATILYPVETVPEERLRTRIVIVSVDHPNFVFDSAELPVKGPDTPIQLTQGTRLEVSGFFGDERQPVLEIVPTLSNGGSRPENWTKNEGGVMVSNRIAPGTHLLRLSGRLASGEIVFSDPVQFEANAHRTQSLSLEMKPGIRLEGRLDDEVARPVTNGRVLIHVRSKEFEPLENQAVPMQSHGYFRGWSSFRPIAEDGSFVFESVPPGEVDVAVHGDGFVSRDGGQMMTTFYGRRVPRRDIRVPQVFDLAAPITNIEIATEPTATLQITARTKRGMPIEGATISAAPNLVRIGGIFGWAEHLTSEEPWRDLPPLPDYPYSAVTDENGIAVLRNLPAHHGSLWIEHPHFEAPAQGDYRYVRFETSPGESGALEVTLQPKGREFTGTISETKKWSAKAREIADFISGTIDHLFP